MRGKLRVADDRRHRARAVAFVRGIEFRPGHDREGRDHRKTEGGGVIVVDREDHIGLVRLHPKLVEIVSSEDWLPIIFFGLAEVEGGADGGDVRGVKGGGDAGHVHTSFRGRWASPCSPILRFPSILRPPLIIMSRYSCSVMPVMPPAICWKLLPSVAPILARNSIL